jgi:DNA-binding XRE family transcriptional regulator
VILHCDHPSFGAGQELEIATSAGIPVLLLMRKGVRVSRMVLGSYARATQVEFETQVDLATALDRAMSNVFNDLSMRVQVKAADIGARILRLREERSLQRYALAQAIGVSEAAIMDLETGAAHRVNPSLVTIRRVATFLKTSVGYLIDGVAPRPEDSDPVLARSQESLHKFASASGVSHADTQRLWSGFVLDYQAQRRAVAEARTEPVSAEEWAQRHSGKAGKRQMSLALGEED